MKRKGSITVFLSLILLLLFSFVLTFLEGARIRGATAYVAMVSELAGDSYLASYYYPLFQEYRLFGVNAGNGEGYLSEHTIVEPLIENVNFGLNGLEGGMLSFDSSELVLQDYETLMTGKGAEFLAQVRKQTVLDGASLALSELFSEEMFTEAGTVGSVYRRQEEALAATANVTKELVKLMELTDGISMGDNGFALDENGRLTTEPYFIKQLVPMEKSVLQAAYENEEIYQAVSGKFYRAEEVAEQVADMVQRAMACEQESEDLKDWIDFCKKRKKSLSAEEKEERSRLLKEEDPDTSYLEQIKREITAMNTAISNASREKKSVDQQRKSASSEAKGLYKEIKKKLDGVEAVLEEGLKVLDRLEKNQKAAARAVGAYEVFLEGTKSALSEELYEVFLQELNTMKLYAGMEEQGYSVPKMRQTVQNNLALLQGFSLKGFSESDLSGVSEEMEEVARGMQKYTVDNLWFTYGEIVVAESTKANILGALSELLATGILSLVGISEEEQSDRSISGVALPSEGMEQETLLSELLSCIEQVEELFQGGEIGAVLSDAGNAALDTTAMELYCRKYFHLYGEESPYTKLNYEREYLLFGKEEDKTNLLYMVLHLVAIRTLFSMVSLLKQPDKTAQLETLAAGVAGFTGIPVLASVVKYSLLLLWSVEEALVEVSALLQGKRIPVIGTGTVSFADLFLMNKTRIAGKAGRLPDGLGACYEDYLTLLSLTRTTRVRMYRMMDLIQENIRYRYNDSFRMRNMVTEITFYIQATGKRRFDTGVFPLAAYEIEWTEQSAY